MRIYLTSRREVRKGEESIDGKAPHRRVYDAPAFYNVADDLAHAWMRLGIAFEGSGADGVLAFTSAGALVHLDVSDGPEALEGHLALEPELEPELESEWGVAPESEPLDPEDIPEPDEGEA